MCAGVTVFSPLKRLGRPGLECAIAGIGGLGHLAIKFSAAMVHCLFILSKRE